MKSFIDNLPKAELHLHIEGSLEPELLFKIAQRNKIALPYNSVDEIRKAYNFGCLQDFLDLYYQGANVLITEQDFYDLTYAYLQKCAIQNVRHTEIMFDPQTHTERGIKFETVINGIVKACDEAEKNLKVSSLLILSYLRHLSEESAFLTLRQSLPFKNRITAVGLDSSERGNPPSKFKNVYNDSIKEGYIPIAHAGEEGPPEYIWEAIDLLEVQRIDHGNNALKDDALVNEIIRRDMALTVCPLSNSALQVVNDLKNHPLKKMLDLGLKVTVNSDDPAYFGGHINKNYFEIQKALNLSKFDLYTLSKNSFEYSFLPEQKKRLHIQELDIYFNNNK